MVAGQRKLMLVRVLLSALFGLVLCGATDDVRPPDARSAHDKIRVLRTGKPPAGTRILLSGSELRAWVQDEAAYWASFGATNLRFTLGQGRATAVGDINFLKAHKAATGQEANWLLKNLFSGTRPISVTARFSSAGGKGRVDVERVEVNGISVEGVALDYLIQDYVKPNFPDARVSEWFPMDFRVDHFTVAPSGVTVVIGK